MATNVSKPAGIGTGRARRSEWRSVAYFTLHGFSFAGSTLLMTWGLFFLFFLALGGFSFDGFIHQLNNHHFWFPFIQIKRIKNFIFISFNINN